MMNETKNDSPGMLDFPAPDTDPLLKMVSAKEFARLESELAALKMLIAESVTGAETMEAERKELREGLDALKKAAIRDGRGGYVDGCVSGSEYKRVHEGQRKALEKVERLETWCPNCGGSVSLDEDLCCTGCGNEATVDLGRVRFEHERAETAEAKIEKVRNYVSTLDGEMPGGRGMIEMSENVVRVIRREVEISGRIRAILGEKDGYRHCPECDGRMTLDEDTWICIRCRARATNDAEKEGE